MEECSKYKRYVVYGLDEDSSNKVYNLLEKKILEKNNSLDVFNICNEIEKHLRGLGFNYFNYTPDNRILRFGICFPECSALDFIHCIEKEEQVFYKLDEEFESTTFTLETIVWGISKGDNS